MTFFPPGSMPSLLEDDQLAAITMIIEAVGFEAGHFTWSYGEEAQTLTHTPTGYTFRIYLPGRLSFHRVVYRPAEMASDYFATSIGTWEDVLRLVGTWLRLVEHEGGAGS